MIPLTQKDMAWIQPYPFFAILIFPIYAAPIAPVCWDNGSLLTELFLLN